MTWAGFASVCAICGTILAALAIVPDWDFQILVMTFLCAVLWLLSRGDWS